MRGINRLKIILLIAVLISVISPIGIVFADSPSIDNVKVFQSYRESGDWLVVCVYNNSETPYYNLSDPADYWSIQLVDNNGMIVTSNNLQQWGMRPGCAYLSQTLASTLEWGNLNYSIRIQAKYNASLSASRTINASDWIGSDMAKLDSWCIFQARTMAVYDGIAYTFDTTKYGTILNSLGGIYFATGIPELPGVRPNIFEFLVSNMSLWQTTVFNNSYAGSLTDWQTSVGPELSIVLTNSGNVFGLSGSSLGAIFIFVVFTALAALAVAMGHFAAGMSIASIMLIAGTIIGFIPLALVIVAGALAFIYWILKNIISST
jgi:hypothetical protein